MVDAPVTFATKADEEFFGAIGRLVISWAHLELGLDCMVEIFYHGFKGNLTSSEIPTALTQKIKFLRKAFRSLQIGEEAISGYLEFLDKIQVAAQTRHDIIHGVVIEQVESSGEATIVRAIRNKNRVEKRRRKVTTAGILSEAVNVQTLGAIVLHLADETHKLIKELSQPL